MPLRSVIFDLDQTLVNSSALEVYRRLGLWDQVIQGLGQILVYDGILDLLQFCRESNLKIAVVTASPRHICEAVLARFGMQADAIVAANEAKFPKPSLHPILKALELVHVQASNAAVIGDRCVDIASGQNAGVGWTIGATWGAADARSLILSNPTFIAASAAETRQLISGLLAPSQYAEWLAGKEAEAKAQFEARMWVDESNDVERGHLDGRHFPYFYCRNRIKGTWTASYANMLVKNLKTAVTQGAQPSGFKVSACEQMADELMHLIRTRNLQNQAVAFVPGSKKPDHAEYDPRFDYVAAYLVRAGIRVTEPIITGISHDAVHSDEDSYENRAAHVVRQNLAWQGFDTPVPSNLFLVDDVLTTGGHFRACVEMIHEYHPEVNIVGAFWTAHLSE